MPPSLGIVSTDLHLTGQCPQISGWYSLGAQMLVLFCFFPTGSWPEQDYMLSPLREESQCPIILWDPQMSAPLCFPSQTSWGLISLVQILGAGCQMWGTNPVLPYLLRSLPIVCCHTRGGIFSKLWLCLPYPSQCVYLLLCREFHLVFRPFSEGNYSYIAINLMFLWEEVKFRNFDATNLDPFQLSRNHLTK